MLGDPVEIGDQPVNVVKRNFQSGHKCLHVIPDEGGRTANYAFPPPDVWLSLDTSSNLKDRNQWRQLLMEGKEML